MLFSRKTKIPQPRSETLLESNRPIGLRLEGPEGACQLDDRLQYDPRGSDDDFINWICRLTEQEMDLVLEDGVRLMADSLPPKTGLVVMPMESA